jgi:RNA polymerase sigma-70 factor (ECF subfamily)
VSDDLQDMACAEWIAAISADADGEDLGVDPRLVAAHLESCPSCRAYRDQVAGLRRASAVAPADEMPDLARNVAKLNAVADRASRWWVMRGLLGLVAVVIMVVSVPALFGEEGPSVHESRHVGAFSVAYAAALLLVVIRPARARAIFPVTLVLAAALFITAVIDVVEGHVPLVDETAHVPELVSVLLVWLLARPQPDPGRVAAARSSDAERSLRLLAPDEGPATERDVG